MEVIIHHTNVKDPDYEVGSLEFDNVSPIDGSYVAMNQSKITDKTSTLENVNSDVVLIIFYVNLQNNYNVFFF